MTTVVFMTPGQLIHCSQSLLQEVKNASFREKQAALFPQVPVCAEKELVAATLLCTFLLTGVVV